MITWHGFTFHIIGCNVYLIVFCFGGTFLKRCWKWSLVSSIIPKSSSNPDAGVWFWKKVQKVITLMHTHNGLACMCKVCTTRQAQSHIHSASLSLIIHYTRWHAYAGDETFKKGVVVDSSVLKYRHIFKNSQNKPNGNAKGSTQKSYGQPIWNTAKFPIFGYKTANLATLTVAVRYKHVPDCSV